MNADRAPTADAGARPQIDVAIVGAEKAGTSSLVFWLGQHPQLVTHRRQEYTQFVTGKCSESELAQTWAECFPGGTAGRKVLIKNVGLMLWPAALDALQAHNPRMHVIAVLREPVARAYSAYWYQRSLGRETAATFEAALSLEDERAAGGAEGARYGLYRQRGRYADQVERLLARFPGQVTIVLFEDLLADPIAVCARIFDAIGVDPSFVPAVAQSRNRGGTTVRSLWVARALNSPVLMALGALVPRRFRQRLRSEVRSLNEVPFEVPPIDPVIATQLRREFAPDITRLQLVLGRDLSHWLAQ